MTKLRWAVLVAAGCAAEHHESPVVAVPPQPPQGAGHSARPANPPPVAAPPPTGPRPPVITQLAVNGADCGLDAAGKAWRWTAGEIEPDVPSLRGARTISCGGSHACVTLGDGSAWCWGGGSYGALGNGGDKASDVPVRVVGLGAVVDIATDFDRTCARTANGDVFCWGDSEFGKAGDGRLPDNVGREKLLPGKAILTGASAIGVGLAHACAVMNDGRLSCWGQNNSGSCGLPLRTRYAPRPVIVPKMKDLASFSASESVSCSVDRAGKVACWGSAANGFLGIPGETARETPVPIALPEPALEVAVGGGFACARLASGTIDCWGNNDSGQLGDGTTVGERLAPAPIKPIGKAVRVSASYDHACALVEGGRVFCWGKGVDRKDVSSTPDASAVPLELHLERMRR